MTTRQTPSSKVVTRFAAICLGWLLCEGLVRILVPSPIFYSTWFTAGVHEPDDSLGFVFAPHYDGAMRHSDGVWLEPLELDKHGFRLAANNAVDPNADPKQTIVVLGGASMAFSFGLGDEETLHHQIAQRLREPTQIELVSWPGFTLAQDLIKLDRFLNATTIDRAIVFAYSDDDYLPVQELALPDPPKSIPMDQGVVLPPDPSSRFFGGAYYRSVVLAGASRWWTALAGIAGLETSAPAVGPEQERHVPVNATSDEPTVPAAVLAARRLRQNGIHSVLIVALPHQLRTIGPESLARYADAGVSVLDLRGMSSQQPMDWIAGGHYGPRAAQAIADQVAEALQSNQTN